MGNPLEAAFSIAEELYDDADSLPPWGPTRECLRETMGGWQQVAISDEGQIISGTVVVDGDFLDNTIRNLLNDVFALECADDPE